ncbi:MAG TPA: glutamate racemase [Candidatus Limosilactobacillus merdigallinarum]|uniref:Glutamate racemase n=1 Tax=Candidatus Limosilactobacillus merdigallinarum TaxID=2838652 RepID=A0A9D2AKG1_9LACO|nr:glutamate racemase [Candidatus Limosilactobacillus merdigallinarum]
MDKRPIGVMDSGLGGLSVVRVMQKRMPNESIIFVGDEGHFPYGTKTQAQVQGLALKIGHFLMQHDIKMMIIACNTATAAALSALQEELPVPVIGVIQPGAKTAVAQPKHDRIGVIATEGTTKTGAYVKTIKSLNPDVTVVAKATQPLVSVVEHDEVGTTKAQQLVDEQLAQYREEPVDVLVLGCTHFPFLANEIKHSLGDQVTLVDPALETVREAHEWLTEHSQLNDASQPTMKLYSTGNVNDLITGADKWLTGSHYHCDHLSLDD